MRENFLILILRAALDHPTFPVNSSSFRVPERCEAAIMDCSVMHVISWLASGNVVESFGVQHYLLLVVSHGTASLNPHCHTGGTKYLRGMMEYSKFQISDMRPGKFLGSMKF